MIDSCVLASAGHCLAKIANASIVLNKHLYSRIRCMRGIVKKDVNEMK